MNIALIVAGTPEDPTPTTFFPIKPNKPEYFGGIFHIKSSLNIESVNFNIPTSYHRR